MSQYTQPPAPHTPEENGWVIFNGYLFQVVCTTAVVWDHISTFDLEVELIWKKKWSLVQLFYFLNRYVGDFSFLYGTGVMLWASDKTWSTVTVRTGLDPSFRRNMVLILRFRCPSFGKTQTWFAIVTLVSMQGIMVHRIIGMHKHEKTVLYSLFAAFVVELIAALILGVVMAVVIGSVPITAENPALRACIPVNWPTWSPGLWWLLMFFDLMIFIMAVREGIRYKLDARKRVRSPEASDILAGTNWPRQHSLLQILLRDSILFPFIGLLMCMFNSLAWYKLPLGALQYTMNISAAGSPILGCRLILNLRDAYYRPFADELNFTTRSVEIQPGYSPDREDFEMPETAMRPDRSMPVSLASCEPLA